MTRITLIQSIRKDETLAVKDLKEDSELVAKLNELSKYSKWQIVKNQIIRVV